jgi:hypothetical protein
VAPSRVMQNRQFTHRNGTRAHVDVQVAISDRWFSAFWLEIAGFSLIDAEGGSRRVCFPHGSKRRVTENPTFQEVGSDEGGFAS